MSHFVTTAWLDSQLDADDLIVLDASWYLPAHNRNAAQEYEEGHIPHARHFDLDTVSDHSSPLPHMLPTPAGFAQAMGDLGISRDSRVVIYDGMGLFSAGCGLPLFTPRPAKRERLSHVMHAWLACLPHSWLARRRSLLADNFAALTGGPLGC